MFEGQKEGHCDGAESVRSERLEMKPERYQGDRSPLDFNLSMIGIYCSYPIKHYKPFYEGFINTRNQIIPT